MKTAIAACAIVCATADPLYGKGYYPDLNYTDKIPEFPKYEGPEIKLPDISYKKYYDIDKVKIPGVKFDYDFGDKYMPKFDKHPMDIYKHDYQTVKYDKEDYNKTGSLKGSSSSYDEDYDKEYDYPEKNYTDKIPEFPKYDGPEIKLPDIGYKKYFDLDKFKIPEFKFEFEFGDKYLPDFEKHPMDTYKHDYQTVKYDKEDYNKTGSLKGSSSSYDEDYDKEYDYPEKNYTDKIPEFPKYDGPEIKLPDISYKKYFDLDKIKFPEMKFDYDFGDKYMPDFDKHPMDIYKKDFQTVKYDKEDYNKTSYEYDGKY